MNEIELFPEDKVIGSFKGHSEGGHDFVADLMIPHKSYDVNRPQFGNFLLVQLSTPDQKQAILGRITKVLPLGRLADTEGEDYIERMRERDNKVPDEIKERMIRYRVRIKLLGVLRVVKDKLNEDKDKLDFMPSQRRLPNLGALVAWPSDDILRTLCKLGGGKTEIGNFVLGEFVYDVENNKDNTDGKNDGDDQYEFIHLSPNLPVTFDIHNLVGKRTAVFARAGYGKSNLMKYLISELYEEPPTTEDKRPVGMLIFDADGEYFWGDKNNKRPGLCDVPNLSGKIAVFTNRPVPSGREHYKKSLIDGVKIDIRRLNPGDVFSIALSPEQQTQQNVRKLKMVRSDDWRELVDLIKEDRMGADISKVAKLLGYKVPKGGSVSATVSAEIGAAINNMNYVINELHSPKSKLLDGILECLPNGNIAIVDVSLLNAKGSEILAGLLMKEIFSHNKRNFLNDNQDPKSVNKPIPVIVVIEEAQRTLGGNLDETSPFVEWVKEGRKYDLGAVMITQQPGALAGELLSQVDNWFCFHVLSKGDAGVLEKYNSHFSEDIWSHMIAEPIAGNCFMWSAPQQPFVLPVRVHKFTTDDNVEGETNQSNVAIKEQIAEDSKKREEERPRLFRQAIYKSQNSLGLKDFDFKDIKLQGIRSGRLFYVIRDYLPVREPDIDSHKMSLMEGLLGQITVLKHDEKNNKMVKTSGGDRADYYYCAPEEEWEKIFSDSDNNSPSP